MHKKVITHFRIRYFFLMGSLLLLLAGLILQLTKLHIFDQDFLKTQGNARTVRLIELPAYRGMITDRNHEPLAISTPVKSVWVNPQEFAATENQLQALAKLLDTSVTNIKAKISKYQHKEFLYLQRHVIPIIGDRIAKLKIPGINLKLEYRRYYPEGEVASHVLGFTNIDDKGQEGLELAYDTWLKGNAGQKRIVKDLLGREVEFLEGVTKKQAGKDLVLSLDRRLQYLAYRELKAAVIEHKAVSGSVVVLHVPTGEVLAMVNQPTFNANMRQHKFDSDNYRNLAVTDYFEPGSVLKTISMVSILENTKITPNTIVDTAPGFMTIKGGIIRDITNNGLLDVVGILKHSSNVGISKLVLQLPPAVLYDTYSRFGFGLTTGSHFPGESSGVLTTLRPNQPFMLATMSFGYGITVTPLQLARAYAILGSGGIKLPVSFVKVDEPPAGRRVVTEVVARRVVAMLTEAVEDSQSKARVLGYHVAGKSGTTRKVGKNGYEEGKHRAVFCGLAPAINPQFAIVVTINEPNDGKYYSSQIAAPVFAKIAGEALRLFDVSPDLMDTQGVHIAQDGNRQT